MLLNCARSRLSDERGFLFTRCCAQLNAAVFARCLRACVGGGFLLSYLSCFKHVWHRFLGLPILDMWSFSRSLSFSLKLVCCRLEICNNVTLATALLSARGLHHCIRATELRVCSRVGLRYVLGPCYESSFWAILCLPLHLWSLCSFLLNPDLFLKLFDSTSTRSFQGGPHFHLGHLSCRTRGSKFQRFFSLQSHDPCVTERQCLVPKSEIQSCWRERGIERPNSLFHDLVGELKIMVQNSLSSRSCCSL